VTPSEEDYQRAISMEANSAIFVPLRARGQVLGVLTLVVGESGRRYEERDRILAEDLANRAAVAVDNARLFREMEVTTADLKRATAAKDEFLGMVSHELRTPITTIFGNAQVLRRIGDRIESSDRAAAILDIEAEAARLQQIIDNMFVLARVESGANDDMEPILVHRELDRLASEHMRRYPHRDVRVRVEPELDPALGAHVYFDQILRNLLSNAEKYSPPSEPVEVEARHGDRVIEVIVLDRGAGVETENETLFDAFYRAPGTAHVSGAGIGLTVCKRLVEAQGGTIWARQREGGGSEFGFALPMDGEETP
jgi:K+-sensing histidine kinase KdpD